MCSNAEIRELLPTYLEVGLDKELASRVEKHLETCADCRQELKLLRMMASEPVPDPGEAFWAAMPESVYRKVQQMQEKKRLIDISSLWKWMLVPRWAWSVATAVLVLIVSLLIVKPFPREIPSITPNGDDAAYEESAIMDTPGLTELSQTELEDVSHWADNELAAVGNDIVDVLISAPERDIHEDLSDLNRQEMEHLSRKLEELEQEEG